MNASRLRLEKGRQKVQAAEAGFLKIVVVIARSRRALALTVFWTMVVSAGLVHADSRQLYRHGDHHGASAIFGSDGPAQPAWIFIVSESRPDGGRRREDTGRDLPGDSEQPDDCR